MLQMNSLKAIRLTGLNSRTRFLPSQCQNRNIHKQHYLDTHKLLTKLEGKGFTQGQCTCIMRAITSLLNEKAFNAKTGLLSNSELEKGTYLFKAALSELRTEVQILRRNDQAALTSEMDHIRKGIDLFTQSLPTEVNQLKVELQMELNTHHHELSFLIKSNDMATQDMVNKYYLEISDLKAQIEAMKWESIRQGILMVFASALALTSITLIFKAKEYFFPVQLSSLATTTTDSENIVLT
ncbi:hypothetical protein DSO57_1018121 [Entomophthora muscae]|uniref:Uncharacterized protein n=2 Tax=Entomophthora muscae TaxID=34485 RepID=A0ACC2T4G2_9FUNG|nr:hypothetical protein DSO57_1013369 [Entomophthora muscae]KAJ9069481.1 hypothetical protein DSO57_1018121 [Entomophthora muscae]